MSVDPTRRTYAPVPSHGFQDLGEAVGGIFHGLIEGIGKILGGALELGIGVLSWIADGVTSLLGGIADAVRGILPNTSPFSPVQDAFRDQQLALTERLDLLEGVEAYANAYMSSNRNAEWSVGNWRDLPFDAQLGPAKGALVDASLGGIVLGSEGLWTLYVRTTARATGFQGGGGVRMDVSVHNPDGSIRTQHVIEGTSLRGTGITSERYGAVTLQATFPVVVDIPGCYVTVRCFAEAWRWWDGGTRWSSMSALKHSSSPEHPGQDTVPDETAPPEPDPPVTPDP